MTVIDYLPVGKEAWPNVLLCRTKKVYYLKGCGLHYRLFNSKYTRINSWGGQKAAIRPLAHSVY